MNTQRVEALKREIEKATDGIDRLTAERDNLLDQLLVEASAVGVGDTVVANCTPNKGKTIQITRMHCTYDYPSTFSKYREFRIYARGTVVKHDGSLGTTQTKSIYKV